MKIKQYTQFSIIDGELEFCVQHEPVLGEVIIETHPEGGHVVGYLSYDHDAPYPLDDCDGLGKIGTSNRRDPVKMQAVYREALGLTRDWRPDLDYVIDLLNAAEESSPNPEWYVRLLNDTGWPVPESGWWENAADGVIEEAYGRMRLLGVIGSQYAVLLDVYEHGGRVYSVGQNPHFPDRQWDCAYGGAVWVPDESLLEELTCIPESERQAKCIEWAKEAVQEDNDWGAGQVFGVCVERFDAEGVRLKSDDVWGHIGLTFARETLVSEVRAALGKEA